MGDVNDHAGKGSLGGTTIACLLTDSLSAVVDNITTGNIASHGVMVGPSPVVGWVGE